MARILLPLAALALAACGSEPADETLPLDAPETPAAETAAAPPAGAALPGDDSTRPYDGIAADEVLRFTGTEPFWGGEVAGSRLLYKTPENQDGAEIAVRRFAGRGGIAYGGTLDGAAFEMTVTPLECSDGMSNRTYPFTVTLLIGEETRNGCGWTERTPFAGDEHP